MEGAAASPGPDVDGEDPHGGRAGHEPVVLRVPTASYGTKYVVKMYVLQG